MRAGKRWQFQQAHPISVEKGRVTVTTPFESGEKEKVSASTPYMLGKREGARTRTLHMRGKGDSILANTPYRLYRESEQLRPIYEQEKVES